jgi:hypothetical protein
MALCTSGGNFTFPRMWRYVGTLLRYVTREPNLRVKRSCMGLGNLEVFLFVSFVSKDYVLGWTLSHLLYNWSDVT